MQVAQHAAKLLAELTGKRNGFRRYDRDMKLLRAQAAGGFETNKAAAENHGPHASLQTFENSSRIGTGSQHMYALQVGAWKVGPIRRGAGGYQCSVEKQRAAIGKSGAVPGNIELGDVAVDPLHGVIGIKFILQERRHVAGLHLAGDYELAERRAVIGSRFVGFPAPAIWRREIPRCPAY